MAALVAPNGARVDVSDAKAERLLSMGFRPAGEQPAADASIAPRGNASRDAWAAHADHLGVEYAEDATRDDIKAAVAAHAG